MTHEWMSMYHAFMLVMGSGIDLSVWLPVFFAEHEIRQWGTNLFVRGHGPAYYQHYSDDKGPFQTGTAYNENIVEWATMVWCYWAFDNETETLHDIYTLAPIDYMQKVYPEYHTPTSVDGVIERIREDAAMR